MPLTPVEGTTNTFTVTDIRDLNVSNITNLFNTGNPLVSSAATHAGAATVKIPLASLFLHGGGRYVNLGDFGLVQDLSEGKINIAPGTYTVQQLIDNPNTGPINISFSTQQAFLDQRSKDYVNRSYIFNTQEYVLDQRSIVEVEGNGNFNFLSYEIRIDREDGRMIEDFDFEGGYTSWAFNTLIGSRHIESDIAKTVILEYVGVGKLGFGYSQEDYKAWLKNTPDIQRASAANPLGTFPFFNPTDALNDIVNELARAGILPKSCFAPGTPIDMWPLDLNLTPGPDGIYDQDEIRAKIWQKPIEQIEIGDLVVSFDENHNLVPGPVTRTFQNDAKILLNFHGTGVTPGHVYFRPDSAKPYKFETLIDILRDDGEIQHQDGSLVRAATNVPVGDPRDGFVRAVTGKRNADGSVEARDQGRIRLGTRFLVDGTRSYAVADLIEAGGGVVGEDELIRVGEGPAMPFHWDFSDMLPQPEDFVLACSGTTLEDIYKAAEWESQGPRLPAPMTLDGGPVQPLSEADRGSMPRNTPLNLGTARTN